MWQSELIHWRQADGTDVEVLNWLDDRSRYVLSATTHLPVREVSLGAGVPLADSLADRAAVAEIVLYWSLRPAVRRWSMQGCSCLGVSRFSLLMAASHGM
jgi:hypothetical protein